ncbi:hypothetical protein KDU71_03030 [Carboxylicivirga sediminis]|uniref:Lipoprotein n=1 Tax=Carboxylicivirga sediminis TaxID=2006564 RepID=A0A941F1L5_9BACT|nr:hypothetical protein [Carboxylicivirga sediminis]MBR8534518.1 hypothetical protein [Carboxylicivirga sediminis]
MRTFFIIISIILVSCQDKVSENELARCKKLASLKFGDSLVNHFPDKLIGNSFDLDYVSPELTPNFGCSGLRYGTKLDSITIAKIIERFENNKIDIEQNKVCYGYMDIDRPNNWYNKDCEVIIPNLAFSYKNTDLDCHFLDFEFVLLDSMSVSDRLYNLENEYNWRFYKGISYSYKRECLTYWLYVIN